MPGSEPWSAFPPSSSWPRPLLDIDDLDARPEWHGGCEALLAFVGELNLPGSGLNVHGERPAQWLHAGMLISVELAYGIPVIALQDDHHRIVILLADAEIETLRAHSRRFST
jgi:hypothetical protein